MRPVGGRSLIVGVLSLVAIAGGGGVVAASEPAGTGPDGLMARFRTPAVKGSVLVDRPAGGGARVTHLFSYSFDEDWHKLIFSSDGCGIPVTAANRTARVWIDLDRNGTAAGQALMEGEGIFLSASVRAIGQGGSPSVCRALTAFEDCEALSAGTAPASCADPDGGYARFPGGSARGLIIFGQSGDDQLSIDVALRAPTLAGEELRIIGTSAPCGEPIGAGERLFTSTTRPHADGMVLRRITVPPVDIDLLGFVRIRAGGETIACRPVGIIAILIG